MRMLKKILACVLTFVMVVGLMPVNVAKAEEGDGPTGLCFAGWDWGTNKMIDLSKDWDGSLPDTVGIALVYATGENGNKTYQVAEWDNITVAYSSEYNDEAPQEPVFSALADGQMIQDNPDWGTKEINGEQYSLGKISVNWYNFSKAGTYKFTYGSSDRAVDSSYLTIRHRAWDFYEGNDVTDTPLRDYYYQDTTENPGFYLVQAESEVALGKLTYDGEDVAIDENGKPVLGGRPVVAVRPVENGEEKDCSNCISYDSKTGKISIIQNPAEGVFDYVVRVYYYYEETYEVENVSHTDYWQEQVDVWVHYGEDTRNAIWLGYDDWNGTVSWKGPDEDKATHLSASAFVTGQEGVVYDVYLTENPEYPDDFNWETATEEESKQYGWRAGSKPLVIVRTGDKEVRYQVDAEDNPYIIDDYYDGDNKTWHLAYTYKAGDEIEVFWSDYDAFLYDDTKQFQIEMDCQNPESAGSIRILPAPAEGDVFRHETYGERYNIAATMLTQKAGVTLTFTPSEGNALEEFEIGDVRYANSERVPEDFEGKTFTPSEDGSYTYELTEADVFAYEEQWDDGNVNKVPATDAQGNQRYRCIHVSACFESLNPDEPDYPENPDEPDRDAAATVRDIIERQQYAFGDWDEDGKVDSKDLVLGMAYQIYYPEFNDSGRNGDIREAYGIDSFDDFKEKVQISLKEAPESNLTAIDAAGTERTIPAYQYTVTLTPVALDSQESVVETQNSDEEKPETVEATGLAYAFAFDDESTYAKNNRACVLAVTRKGDKENYFLRCAYAYTEDTTDDNVSLVGNESEEDKAILVVADFDADREDALAIFGNGASLDYFMSQEGDTKLRAYQGRNEMLLRDIGKIDDWECIFNIFAFCQEDFTGVRVKGQGASGNTPSWAFANYPIYSTSTEEAVEHEAVVYFGNDTITLEPVVYKTGFDKQVTGIQTVACAEQVPEQAVSIQKESDQKWTVEFHSDFYDVVKFKVVYTLADGGEWETYLTVHRVGIDILSGGKGGDSDTMTLFHGTENGPEYKPENGFVIWGTYYYPTQTKELVDLYVTYTWKDGSVTRKKIPNNADLNLAYHHDGTDDCQSSDFILYDGEPENAPVRVEAMAVAQDFESTTSFGGAKYGAGKGVAWNNDYREDR